MLITRRAQLVLFLVAGSVCFGTNTSRATPVLAAMPSENHSRAAAKIRAAAENLSTWVNEQNAKLSLYVGTADSTTPLAEVNADRPLNPASNTKLLTMVTALQELHPEFRFNTRLCGRLDGGAVETLGIGSNGDPTIDRAAMLDLAFQLVQRGVKQVKRIVVDQSAFDDKFTPPAFEQQPNEWSPFRAPVSAVAFNGNSVSVSISPTEATKPASATGFPASFLDWVITARTRRAKEKARPIEVTPSAEKSRLKLRVSGTIPEGADTVTVWRRVEDPQTFAGYALADSLRALGVRLSPELSIETGQCENLPELAHRTSPTLGTILHQLGKDSDNFAAEMLVKAIGAHATGKPGTTADGLEVIRQLMSKVHPLAVGSRLANGSGLFDANRVSAEQFAAVLRYARQDPHIGPEFVSSLAVAGRDGTLRKRFERIATATVRGKTGSLNQVVSLSGYIEGPRVEPLIFSVLINGLDGVESAKSKLDGFVTKLVESERSATAP
jgi:serine-type D-Ala-D-Ala carboxypeptidase/endopeptidase (penicillin-binding protein 4)